VVIIKKRRNESKDTLFRKFTKIFINERVVDEVRSRLFFKKPSIIKKEKRKEMLKKHKQSYRRI